MLIRELMEARERDSLSPHALLSIHSKGRSRPEEPCPMRTAFQRDRDRIIHSKSFRRLIHKTQVFISPEGDHYRTRLTHTLEVAQIARTAARALRLNEDLTEAIALGHDLGHTPFGHAGERALNHICPSGFRHNQQSVRVATLLEREGRGLNLTHEVLDGIVCHTGETEAATLEGKIVKLADRIAYINHDIDDALRAGILKTEDIPADLREILGESHSGRIDCMVRSLINASFDHDDILMDPIVYEAMLTLRQFMFAAVYKNPAAKGEESKAEELIRRLYVYFSENLHKLPLENQQLLEKEEKEHIICDYIAGMTDRYAVKIYGDIFVPKRFTIL